MPMKVIHVETGRHLYGGALQVFYLLRGLSANRFDNVLVCPEGSEIAREAATFTEKTYAIKMHGDMDISFIWRLRRIIQNEQPDIIHLHSRRGADTLGGLASLGLGKKVVLTRRVDNPESKVVVGLKYSLYDKVVTISKGIRDVLLSEGLDKSKIECVPSAVDTEKYSQNCNEKWFRGEFKLQSYSKVVGMTAQFIERKGHRYLLQAIPAVLEQTPDVVFLFLGKGPLLEQIKSRVLASHFKDHVIFAGFRKDLDRILPCLTVLIHPAEMEGLGVSLLQAAASGVPIIATDVGGIPEIVKDKVNGYLIPVKNTAAISEALNAILTDLDAARKMGVKGREIVESAFSIEAMVEGNMKIYRELVQG